MFVTRKGKHKDEIRIEGGQWWPVLNGQEIFLGTTEPITMELPLTVEIPTPDQ
jgi:hypothetical protein